MHTVAVGMNLCGGWAKGGDWLVKIFISCVKYDTCTKYYNNIETGFNQSGFYSIDSKKLKNWLKVFCYTQPCKTLLKEGCKPVFFLNFVSKYYFKVHM